MDQTVIDNIFTYHAPKSDQGKRYDEIRKTACSLATVLNILCPDSREKSVAITKLQEAVMWANASIAINE